MTIEATFANASLISPRTCSFAALSIVAPVACPKPTTLSNGRLERVARDPRCAPAAWHHLSPQAASDGRPTTWPEPWGGRGHRRLLRRGFGIWISRSVGGLLRLDGHGRHGARGCYHNAGRGSLG